MDPAKVAGIVSNLFREILGNIGQKLLDIPGFPKIKYGLGHGDDAVAALHMDSFAIKMNQIVLALGELINAGGKIPDGPFSPNFIVINGEEPGELF